ncbi:MAG: hypothetical protein COS14_10850, partial [Bacteroidetes bacterium CG02_land_8_20_14_3_00_31_25]
SETGAVLLTMPNVYNNFVSSTGTNGTKLICWHFSSPITSDVYSLLGSLPFGIKLLGDNEDSNLLGNAYPNPTQNQITIPYSLPQGCKSGELIIYDIAGKEIQKYQVDKIFDNLLIDTTTLKKGQYLYKIFIDN